MRNLLESKNSVATTVIEKDQTLRRDTCWLNCYECLSIFERHQVTEERIKLKIQQAVHYKKWTDNRASFYSIANPIPS
jgi:hypothetical protein